VHEETQHQDCIEACGYRSPTWRVLRAHKAIIDAKVMVGESEVTADTILDDDQANQRLKEAWEHDDSKDELKIDLQGLERHFWLGTEAGRLGCGE